MKSFGLLNIALVVVLIIAMSAVSFFSVIFNNFKDVPSTLKFLEKANVYVNVSTLIQLQIQEKYPPVFKNNVILNSVADKLVTAVVSPSLVERVATPALKASVKFAQAPTSIVDDKVVIATAQYKSQAKQAIESLGLPALLVVNISYIIDAIPASLTLVDTQKHPNSAFAWIIKMRTLLQYNHTAMNVSWVVFFITFIIIFIHNLSNVKRLFLAFWIAFLLGGVALIIKSYAIPRAMEIFLPQGTESLTVAQNSLVLDSVAYLLTGVRTYGIVFTVLGLILLAAWRFCDFTHFQKTLDKRLKKVHVPEVSIKVK